MGTIQLGEDKAEAVKILGLLSTDVLTKVFITIILFNLCQSFKL